MISLLRTVPIMPFAIAAATVGLGSLAPAITVAQGTPKSAKTTITVFTGGADKDLKALRESLQKLAGLKFNAADIGFSDIKRDGGVFTKFVPIELTDRSKTDIGALAQAVAAAGLTKSGKTAGVVYVIIRYRPDSTNNEKLRAALAPVKGVQADKSWAGDQNLWVNVDSTGAAKLAEITRALHDAGIPIRDPILDSNDP